MSSSLTLLIEIVAAGLLVAVLVYAIRLNRLLASLKADKGELERLVQTFHQATARAEQSVAKLRTSATEVSQILQANVAKAEKLRDELVFIVDRASADADRLESAIAAARHSRPTAAAASLGASAPNVAESVTGPSGGGRAVLRSTTRTVTSSRPDEAGSAPDAADSRRRKTKSELLKALEGMR